jgi:hypothetical protein
MVSIYNVLSGLESSSKIRFFTSSRLKMYRPSETPALMLTDIHPSPCPLPNAISFVNLQFIAIIKSFKIKKGD